jgi:hypothetical protein
MLFWTSLAVVKRAHTITEDRLARALFQANENVIGLIAKVGEAATTPDYWERRQHLMNKAWERNEFGARVEAERMARRVFAELEEIARAQ